MRITTVAFLALTSCGNPPTAAPTATATSPAPTAAATGGPASAGGIAWDAPKEWEKVAHPSPMRKATYKIPRAEGDTEDGEMTVTQVGGDLESNIQRWSTQFMEKPTPARNELSQSGLKITVVEMSGTYQGMAAPGAAASGPKEGFGLLAAIVEGEGLAQPFFFKMVGPQKTVTAARSAFDTFVQSFRRG
jgi:hypothetical protein